MFPESVAALPYVSSLPGQMQQNLPEPAAAGLSATAMATAGGGGILLDVSSSAMNSTVHTTLLGLRSGVIGMDFTRAGLAGTNITNGGLVGARLLDTTLLAAAAAAASKADANAGTHHLGTAVDNCSFCNHDANW